MTLTELRQASRILSNLGLQPLYDLEVLACVIEGIERPFQIAQKLGVVPNQATRALKRLEEAGLVTLKPLGLTKNYQTILKKSAKQAGVTTPNSK